MAQIQEGTPPSNLVMFRNDKPKFAIGTKIRLKSGGPEMTVSNGTPTMVEAMWFEGKCLHRAAFNNMTVMKTKGGGVHAQSR